MNINNMKDVFIFSNSDSSKEANIMLNYIKNTLNIDEVYLWNLIGDNVISVPFKDYEYVLVNARKYAIKKAISMQWLDYYNVAQSISEVNIGFGILSNDVLPNECKKKYSKKNFDGIDDTTKNCLLKYFDEMKKYLEVDKISREYYPSNKGILFSTPNLDHEKQYKLLNEFIKNYGYGPFEEIHPLTITGEYIQEPMQTKKIKSKKKKH